MTSKKHEEMKDEGVCPRCDERELYRDSADVGVGIIYGPWGCTCCGWSESEQYDLEYGGGLQENGSYLDQYGGLTPAENPIAKMLAQEAKKGDNLMGTDIHVTAQKRVNGEWVDVPTDFMSDRNYAAFGWLADVRNYAGVPPLHPNRGVPEGVNAQDSDWHHGHTWYFLDELTSFDFDQPVENRRVTRHIGQNVWSGGCTASPGEGQMTTYRELFGEYFMEGIRQLAESEVERIIISFDS